MTETPSGYRPGVCNIGSTERRRRYRYAGVSAVVAVVYAAGVLALSAPVALLLGLFVPLSLGTEFFLQARRSFCAGLGFGGRFDLRGDEAGTGAKSVVVDGESATRSTSESHDSAVRNDGPSAGGVGRVTDPAARATDRRYALRLTVLGVSVGATGAILVYGVVALFG